MMYSKEIVKKKAEVYDLIMQKQDLENRLNALNQVILQKIQEINLLQSKENTRNEEAS